MPRYSIEPFLGVKPREDVDMFGDLNRRQAIADQAEANKALAAHWKDTAQTQRRGQDLMWKYREDQQDDKTLQKIAYWANIAQNGATAPIRAGAARALETLGVKIAKEFETSQLPDAPQAEGELPPEDQAAKKLTGMAPGRVKPEVAGVLRPNIPKIAPTELRVPPEQTQMPPGIASGAEVAQLEQERDDEGNKLFPTTPRERVDTGRREMTYKGEHIGTIDPDSLTKQTNSAMAAYKPLLQSEDPAVAAAAKRVVEMAPGLAESEGVVGLSEKLRHWYHVYLSESKLRKPGGGGGGGGRAQAKLTADQNAQLWNVLRVTNQQYRPAENVKQVQELSQAINLIDENQRTGLADTVSLNLLSKMLNGIRASDPDFRRLAEGEGKVSAWENIWNQYSDAGLRNPQFIQAMRRVFSEIQASAMRKAKEGGSAAARLAQVAFRNANPEEKELLTQAAYEYYDPYGQWRSQVKSAGGKKIALATPGREAPPSPGAAQFLKKKEQ